MPFVGDQRFRAKDRPFSRPRLGLAPRMSPGPAQLVGDDANGRATLAEHPARLPVMIMTGSVNQAVLALKVGAADFVQKPFGRSDMLSVPEHPYAGAGGD